MPLENCNSPFGDLTTLMPSDITMSLTPSRNAAIPWEQRTPPTETSQLKGCWFGPRATIAKTATSSTFISTAHSPDNRSPAAFGLS